VTATSGTSGAAPPTRKVVCTVPKLKGKSLAAATSALRRAHCALGKVTKPKKHSKGKLVVTSSSPSAGTKRPKGTKVKLTLGPPRRKLSGSHH
jgi:beta-lactam-binding protein with PASTA domain